MTTVNIGKAFPDTYEAMASFSGIAEKAAADAGLDPLVIELVKIRVSQLNGCGYCLRAHCRDALSHGESADRLAVLAAWWETQLFSPLEQAALTLAEQITRISETHWSAGSTTDLSALDDPQIAAVEWLAIVMNAWNRVAISSHYKVGA